jgi:hypothetical protein
MEATPFEHVVVIAVAANCTGEPTVSPLAGLLTTTFANTGAENAARISMALKKVFKKLSPRVFTYLREPGRGEVQTGGFSAFPFS